MRQKHEITTNLPTLDVSDNKSSKGNSVFIPVRHLFFFSELADDAERSNPEIISYTHNFDAKRDVFTILPCFIMVSMF